MPPGYTEWYGLHGNSKYYNYTLNENGALTNYGNADADYLTDVLVKLHRYANRGPQFLQEFILFLQKRHAQKFISQQTESQPFFAMISPPAPHAPFTPAPRHADAFDKVKALRTPNFNTVSDELGKHWLVRMGKAPLDESVLDNIDTIYRRRWQTLLAVDELVESIVQQLQQQNLFEQTYFIFTSDHGYHLGQFSMPFDKRQPYETDIRVPFIVTGPKIKAKLLINRPISLIDLAPTLLDWANVTKPDWLDGETFANALGLESNEIANEMESNEDDDSGGDRRRHIDNAPYERELLIEHWGEGNAKTYNAECPWQQDDRLTHCTVAAGCHCQDSWNNTYSCIRHLAGNWDKIYCEFFDREVVRISSPLFTHHAAIT